MADLEKLIVSLQADLKQYEKEMARAQSLTVSKLRAIEKQAQASATRIEAGFSRVGRGFVALLSVGTFLRLADQVQESVKAIADLNEAAQKAGVSIGDLQRFMAAGVGAGLDQSQIVSMLAKFNRTLGEAKAKGAEIGSTTEEFLRLADAIQAANTPAERAVLIQQNLGKAGAEAIPLLIQGSAALEQQMREATVASDALVQAADEFYDEWAVKLKQWGTLFQSTIASAATSLNTLFTGMGDRTKAQLELRRQEILDSLSRIKFDLFADAPGGSNELRAELELIEEMLRLQARLRENAPAAAAVTTAFEAGAGAEAEAKAIEKLGTVSADTSTDLEDMLNSMVEVDQAFLESQEQAEALQDAFQGAFRDLVEGARDGKLGLQELLGVLDGLSSKLIQMAADKAFQFLIAALSGTGSAPSLGSLSFGGPRAGGGPVSTGSAYMVGEKGPEMFVPSQSGQILPAGSGGGPAPIINITNMPGVQSTQSRSSSGGHEVVDIVNRVMEGRFPDLLNRNAGLIGAKPVSRRTF